MNETSVYIVERDAWSIERQCEVHFRLTYERVFLPVQNLWRDFLVHSEEIGAALPAASQYVKNERTSGMDEFFGCAISHNEPLISQHPY